MVSSIFLEFMSLEYWNRVKEVEIGEMTYIIQSLKLLRNNVMDNLWSFVLPW